MRGYYFEQPSQMKACFLAIERATRTGWRRRSCRLLERLIQGRTTFVTSHRLSVVRGTDRIAALDDGRLVELGTHAELLAAGGLYAAMYRRQMGDLTGEALEPARR